MSNGTLMAANRQWATRPDDQRFDSLKAMYLAMFLAAQTTSAHDISQQALRVEVANNDLVLATPAGQMDFSHWSFGQLSQRIGAPASWLRTLDPELAALNLNAGLARSGIGDDAQMYFRQSPGEQRAKLLALTSTKYGRIYNHEVLSAVMNIPGNWTSPLSMPKAGEATRPATEDDVKYGTNLQIGEDVSTKRALYGSDKDMFAFLVDNDRRVDDGTDGGLGRGFFVSNSEVGDATFSITRFLYRYVCRNNIVWGAKNVEKISIKHLGRGARGRAFDSLEVDLKNYANASAVEDEARIRSAKNLILGRNVEDVQDKVFRELKIVGKSQVSDAYELATRHEDVDGNPNTAWGFAQGLTRLSQLEQYTDDRVALDLAASKVLALAA